MVHSSLEDLKMGLAFLAFFINRCMVKFQACKEIFRDELDIILKSLEDKTDAELNSIVDE